MANLSSLYRQLIYRCIKQSCHRPGCLRLMARDASSGMGMSGARHNPSQMEKRMLVLCKSYPSMDAVPDVVSYTQMKRAKDWFRIRVSILMILTTFVACVFVIRSGRKALARGDTLTKRNLEWHRRIKEEAEAQKK